MFPQGGDERRPPRVVGDERSDTHQDEETDEFEKQQPLGDGRPWQAPSPAAIHHHDAQRCAEDETHERTRRKREPGRSRGNDQAQRGRLEREAPAAVLCRDGHITHFDAFGGHHWRSVSSRGPSGRAERPTRSQRDPRPDA